MHLRRTPYLMRAPFAQAEQPGGVVNLAIGENNAANMCAAQNLFLIKFWRMGNLLADIGGGVTQHPLFAVIADDDRRLGARGRLKGTVAQTLTVGAVTVPLGETTASGGTEDFNKHEDGPGSQTKMPARMAGRAISGWKCTGSLPGQDVNQ